jgi:hypothetical protein
MVLTKKQIRDLLSLNNGGTPSGFFHILGIKYNPKWMNILCRTEITEQQYNEARQFLIDRSIDRKKEKKANKNVKKVCLIENNNTAGTNWNRKNIESRKNINPSSYEKIVINILTDLNINFLREHTITKMVSKNGNNLFFDFYLPNYNLAIEYDGYHHFIESNVDVINNDRIKNEFSEKYNINLIRISKKTENQIRKLICKKLKELPILF